MALPNYKELEIFNNNSDINDEIFKLQKTLFNLRAKRAVNQAIKPHVFSHLKRRIAQLKFKKSAEIK